VVQHYYTQEGSYYTTAGIPSTTESSLAVDWWQFGRSCYACLSPLVRSRHAPTKELLPQAAEKVVVHVGSSDEANKTAKRVEWCAAGGSPKRVCAERATMLVVELDEPGCDDCCVQQNSHHTSPASDSFGVGGRATDSNFIREVIATEGAQCMSR